MTADALIATQHGVVRRQQLLRAGISPTTIHRRLRRQQWQRVLPGVYALFTGPLGAVHRLLAGWLYAGAHAQFAGPTAARMHGLRRPPDDGRVHLLVPHHRQLASVDFVAIHRTSRLDPAPTRITLADTRYPAGGPLTPGYPVAVCSVTRAVADTARWCGPDPAVRALIAEAVHRQLTGVRLLRAEATRSRRNGSAALRAALAEVETGGRHQPASDLRTCLLQSRTLPAIHWDPTLVGLDGRRLPGPDGWLDDVGLGIEIDAGARGASPDVWEHTMARHALLAGYGALVLHFPAARLRQDPAGIRTSVERAYQQRRRSGAHASLRAG